MAVDKLVDSAKLNAALNYEANKIISKGGGTAPLAFDFANEKGFGDYIDAIPSGGGGDTLEIKGARTIDFYWETGYPVKYKAECGVFYALNFKSGEVAALTNIEEIEFTGGAQSAGTTVAFDFRANADHKIKSINFNFIVLQNIYNFGFLYINRALHFESLLGLNFAKVGGGNYRIGNMANMDVLKNITCKPNTLGQLDMVASNRNWWSLSKSSLLTDASLCQIANALCATHTSTLTLHATPKARCSTLMGTVSQVTDDTGTYDFFTADENGTVSLADFITTTKGWTLA